VTIACSEGQFEGQPCPADDTLISESLATGQAIGGMSCLDGLQEVMSPLDRNYVRSPKTS